MLTIRQEQVDAFKQRVLDGFAGRMVEQLKMFFPLLAGRLGEQGLRDVVQHGIGRAREYGIVRQCDVGRYIAVMLMFGPNFDRKTTSGPLYAILRDPHFSSPAARTAALCRAVARALRDRTLRTGRKPHW